MRRKYATFNKDIQLDLEMSLCTPIDKSEFVSIDKWGADLDKEISIEDEKRAKIKRAKKVQQYLKSAIRPKRVSHKKRIVKKRLLNDYHYRWLLNDKKSEIKSNRRQFKKTQIAYNIFIENVISYYNLSKEQEKTVRSYSFAWGEEIFKLTDLLAGSNFFKIGTEINKAIFKISGNNMIKYNSLLNKEYRPVIRDFIKTIEKNRKLQLALFFYTSLMSSYLKEANVTVNAFQYSKQLKRFAKILFNGSFPNDLDDFLFFNLVRWSD